MLERHEAGPCRARVAPANAPREGEANAALLADKKDEEGGVRQTSTHVEMGRAGAAGARLLFVYCRACIPLSFSMSHLTCSCRSVPSLRRPLFLFPSISYILELPSFSAHF